MADDNAAAMAALGRIEANLGHVQDTLGDQKRELTTVRESTTRIEQETTVGFGEIRTAQATMSEKLDGHIQLDDTKFADVEADISRAHAKLGRLAPAVMTNFGGDTLPPQPAEGMSRAKQGGILGGILAGLGALGTALASWLGGQSGAN
jgi:hypothetical protein